MTWEFERVAGPFGFTEGPVWDGEAVLFSDIANDRIHRYTVASGERTIYREGTNGANGMTLGSDGSLYACEGDAHRVVRYDGDRVVVLADSYEGKRLNSPNDLTFDGRGRLWFTDPDYEYRDGLELGHESVYRLDPSGDGEWEITRMTDDTTKPNGLLISPDGERLYVAQSDYRGDLEFRVYPIEGDELGAPTVLHDFAPHRGVDGMAFDVDENVVACAGWAESGPGPSVYAFSPDGTVQGRHPFPVDVPTNCAFGDADLRSLYVTAGEGSLFRARTETRGYLGPA